MQKGFWVFLCTMAVLGLMVAAASVSAAGPNIQEGKWQITTKVDMPGMPADMPQQTFTHTECLTKDDYVPRGSQTSGSGGDCEIRDVRRDGNTVTWTMHCNTGQGEMNGKGSITYNGDSFEGTIESVMSGMQMTQHLNGQRIGDCE